MAQLLTNPTRIHEHVGLIPDLAQRVKNPESGIAVSCGVGRSSDPTLLWLWCRPVAAALIGPLAREPPYAAEAAQEKAKKDQKKEKRKETKRISRNFEGKGKKMERVFIQSSQYSRER